MTSNAADSGFFAGVPGGVEPSSEFVSMRRIYASASGFCEVWQARRDGKLFILKALREDLRGDAVAGALLRKEYDAGFAVVHPAVVHTYDLVEVPALGQAILLEYCPGVTLESIIDSGQTLDPERLSTILQWLCDGLAAIHLAGIVHRDIKPANIIVADSGAPVRIIDFGCADAAVYTQFKEPAGTPRFTPADARSAGVEAKPRLDIYALGVTVSLLAPLCNSARYRRRLIRISETLTADGDSLTLDRVRELLAPQPRSYLRYAIFLMAAASAALGYFFIPATRHEDASVPSAVAPASRDSVPRAEPTFSALTPSPPASPLPSEAVEPEVTEAADTRTFVVNDQTVYAAKYSSNPIDKYAVDLTDDYCQMLADSIDACQQCGDEQSCARLRSRLTDADAIVNLLSDRVLSKYPEAPADVIRQIVAVRHRQFIRLDAAPYLSTD